MHIPRARRSRGPFGVWWKTALASSSLLLVLSACGSGGGSGGSGGSGGDEGGAPAGCANVEHASDGPTADAIADGASTLVCYYDSPNEGYCRKITDPDEIALFYDSGKDKGAIGCADAFVLSDTECPTANAVGKCTATTIEAERLYYECSKFDDPTANCAAVGGTYSAL
jgi:hypothetical protein